MSNPIVHVELSAGNHDELAGWYARHFGWKLASFPEMQYTTLSWSDQPGNGVGIGPENPLRPVGVVLCYIHTDDIDASVAAIEADGGIITMPKMDVPTVGAMAWFKDPEGNPMALLQPEMPSVAGEDA
ncbi:MAG: VOC family protein [Caldilineaceae bacterium]